MTISNTPTPRVTKWRGVIKRKLAGTALAVTMILGAASGAMAQVDMMSIPVWTSIGSLNQMSLNQTLFGTNHIPDGDTSKLSKAKPSQAKPSEKVSQSTTITLSKAPQGPARLGAAYPESQRPKAQALFGQMLDIYGQVATKLGVKENDVAGSVAAFVAGSWMAYHDKEVPDADFPILVAQMRGVLAKTPAFTKASLQQKQELHEGFAILGTLMASSRLALKQSPNPQVESAMREAAGSYLKGFIGVDPDNLVIDGKGLRRI